MFLIDDQCRGNVKEYLKEKKMLVDGAHNPEGTKALRESLEKYFPNQKYKFKKSTLKVNNPF